MSHKRKLFYVAVVDQPRACRASGLKVLLLSGLYYDVPVCSGPLYKLQVGLVRPSGSGRVWKSSALTARAAVRKLREAVVAFAYECDDGGNEGVDLERRGRGRVDGEWYLRKYFVLDLQGDPAFEVVK